MKPWLLVAVGILCWPAIASGQFVGAGSCAAAACHNANFARGLNGSEFTHWTSNDRHARAYETLFKKKALDIVARLGSRSKAHEDRRCLTCHVHPDYAEIEKSVAYFKTDGVSCESCHGPARGWLADHYLPSWRDLSPAQKEARGMRDTQSAFGRARICVSCHLGAAGMEVDHDLIAAGHPRLHFEFTAYHAQMPRHWPATKDRDFDERAWVAGQLVSAQAALDLLAHRVRSPNWPEFAEFDCASCHHPLKASPDRPIAKRKQGSLAWGSYVAISQHLIDWPDLRALQATFERGDLRPAPIIMAAKKASTQLAERLQSLDLNRVSASKGLARYLDRGVASQDEWMQAELGFIALRRPPTAKLGERPVSLFDPPALRNRLQEGAP